ASKRSRSHNRPRGTHEPPRALPPARASGGGTAASRRPPRRTPFCPSRPSVAPPAVRGGTAGVPPWAAGRGLGASRPGIEREGAPPSRLQLPPCFLLSLRGSVSPIVNLPSSGPGILLFLRKPASSSFLCRAPTSATPDGTRARTPSADTGCPGRPATRARDTGCHTFVQRLVTPHTL